MKNLVLLFLLFVFIFSFSGCQGQKGVQLHSVIPKEIPKLINKLPSYARFGFWGLCFYDDTLFVSTNIGLLKLKQDSIIELLKWYDKDDVVSESWIDIPSHKLWLMHDGMFVLLSFDGRTWQVSKIPDTKGGYTRGDVLQGYRMYSTKKDFFLEGGGTFWKWSDTKNKWEEQSPPINLKKTKHYSFNNSTLEFNGGLTRILPTENKLFCVVRYEPTYASPSDNNFLTDEIYSLDGEWKHIPNITGYNFFVEDVVPITDSASYILTKDKKIICLSQFKIDTITMVGHCDAIAKSSKDKLIASFRGLGIYEYDNGWRKVFSAPQQIDSGEFWTFLAENNNEFVLAMTPHDDKKKSKLWISSGDILKEIKIEK